MVGTGDTQSEAILVSVNGQCLYAMQGDAHSVCRPGQGSFILPPPSGRTLTTSAPSPCGPLTDSPEDDHGCEGEGYGVLLVPCDIHCQCRNHPHDRERNQPVFISRVCADSVGVALRSSILLRNTTDMSGKAQGCLERKRKRFSDNRSVQMTKLFQQHY